MSVTQNIIDALKNQGAIPDLAQLNLINRLVDLKIYKSNPLTKLFIKQKNYGIYIWGDVGRGKTLISSEFIKQVKNGSIKSFHYIDFMDFIHNELNKNSGSKNPLFKVAKILTKKTSLIFIDEFQVEDVADAMIIGDLLIKVLDTETKLILTSNAHPDNLYKDGLQRKKFMDSIKFLKEKVDIFELNGDIDYRTNNIINLNTNDNKNIYSEEDISLFIAENFGTDHSKSGEIEINNRRFGCKLALNNILWIEFSKFFKEPTGASDYKYISDKFDWIFISNFQHCDDDSIDLIRRFISFIDVAYVEKTKVKFFFDDIEFNDLYSGTKIEILWHRCSSRLTEMQSSEYLNRLD
jgi:cell division protein ZapE